MMLPTDFPDRQIALFAGRLRKRGIHVSAVEMTDTVRALALMDIMNIGEFREVMRLCLIKRIEDSAVFDEEFKKFFFTEDVMLQATWRRWKENLEADNQSNAKSSDSANVGEKDNVVHQEETDSEASSGNRSDRDAEEQQEAERQKEEGQEGQEGQKEDESWRRALAESKGVPNSFTAFVSGDELGAVKAARRERGQMSGTRILEAVWQATEDGTIGEAQYAKVLRALEDYKKLFASLKEFRGIEPVFETERKHGERAINDRRNKQDLPLDLPLASLNQQQMYELQEHIRQSAQVLYTRLVRLDGSNPKRMHFDYPETIRKSLATFGEPFWPVYRARKRKLRQLVTICDVSGSVKYATRILLNFMYEVHQAFEGRARHFIFVGRLDEVTSFFSENSFDGCFAKAMGAADVDYRGYSNYSLAFQTFVRHFIDAVDSDTVVLVLGDARNNRWDPGTRDLEEISVRARRSVWLNPEAKNKWDGGDSIMSKYRRHVGEVVEISRFGQLLQFVDDLPAIVGTV